MDGWRSAIVELGRFGGGHSLADPSGLGQEREEPKRLLEAIREPRPDGC